MHTILPQIFPHGPSLSTIFQWFVLIHTQPDHKRYCYKLGRHEIQLRIQDTAFDFVKRKKVLQPPFNAYVMSNSNINVKITIKQFFFWSSVITLQAIFTAIRCPFNLLSFPGINFFLLIVIDIEFYKTIKHCVYRTSSSRE